MRLPTLVEGRFLRRLNRFTAAVEIEGREVLAHLPNSGRLRELMVPGAPCYVTPRAGPGRKTSFDLTLVEARRGGGGAGEGGRALVSVDTRLPNAMVREAWEEGRLAGFEGYSSARMEVPFGGSRLDMALEGPLGRCLIEVKSVTLVVDGLALFPDSPTERGRRHVRELAEGVRQGWRAAALFVVQREDAGAVAPNDAEDPAFGAALRSAVAAGVEARAFGCRVGVGEAILGGPLSVLL